MTQLDFARPRSGAVLNAALVARVTYQAVRMIFVRVASIQIQLANNGGAIPVLCAEIGKYRLPVISVRFYDPCEGHELTQHRRSLLGYAIGR